MLLNLIERRGALQTLGSVSDYIRWLVNVQSNDVAAGVPVSEDSAMALTYVYACIRVLSETVGHLPLNVYRRTATGREEDDQHPLWNLLHNEPNPWMSSQVWRETLMGHASSRGNAYSWIERGRDGQVVALWPLHPDRTHPEIVNGTLVYRSTLPDSSQQTTFAAIDVLHIPALAPDGIKGYSPIQVAKQAVGLGLAAQEFGARFFGNGANPRMVIRHPGKVSDPEKYRETFDKQFAGVRDSHGTVVLTGGAEMDTITIPPEDAQFLETRQFNRTEIAGIFRVPPDMIGDLSRSTFSNAEQMDLKFAKHTIAPWCTKWEAEINRKLLAGPRNRKHFAKMNMNALMRGDTQTRGQWYHFALADGWMSRNEVRRKEDLPTEDGLDEFLAPMNFAPVADRTEPLARSMAEKLASCERRALERCGEDVSAAAEFWRGHGEFVDRHVRPIAESLQVSDGINADDLVRRFTDTHINRQLGKIKGSIAEAIPLITESDIVKTFSEVAHGD